MDQATDQTWLQSKARCLTNHRPQNCHSGKVWSKFLRCR